MLLDLGTCLTEVTFCNETPMQGADDPILEALNVGLNGVIHFRTPRRESVAISFKPFDTLVAKFAGVIDSGLNVEVL